MILCLTQSTVFLNSGRMHSYGPCEMEDTHVFGCFENNSTHTMYFDVLQYQDAGEIKSFLANFFLPLWFYFYCLYFSCIDEVQYLL